MVSGGSKRRLEVIKIIQIINIQKGFNNIYNNDYPKYFRNIGNDIYASYDGIWWFWYANTECC